MNTVVLENSNDIKVSMINRIVGFLVGECGGVAAMQEIYKGVKEQFIKEGKELPNYFENKVRSIIYKNRESENSKDKAKKPVFRCVAKGVWMVIGENTAGLIIHGDGRKLDEIEDNSIDFIITDHPWEDKKNHRSGNQKNFSGDYEDKCFKYTQEDFMQKARVLKKGGYLVEFMPMESESNYQYLYSIKDFAKKAGLKYYAKLIWLKAQNHEVNTGRCTKGMEDIVIFSKGKPRRLAPKGKPYMTKNMLDGRIDIPVPKGNKKHQAAKNVDVYKYLMDNISLEGEVGLDQFAGSFNAIEAAISLNRFMIGYDCKDEYIDNATNRFKAIPLYVDSEYSLKEKEINETGDTYETFDDVIGHVPENDVIVLDCIDEKVNDCDTEEQLTFLDRLNEIPEKISKFQLERLRSIVGRIPNITSEENNLFIENLKSTKNISNVDSEKLNRIFKEVFENAHKKVYSRLNINLDNEENKVYESITKELKVVFNSKVKNEYLRPYYANYLIESKDFCKYIIKKYNARTLEDVRSFLINKSDEYIEFNDKKPNSLKKNKVITKRILFNVLGSI